MHARTPAAQLSARIARSGFTLIEIMVVIAIIGILSAIALLVGNRVTQGARGTLTKDMLKVLDQAMTGYTSDRSGKLPSIYRDPAGNEFPVFDGRVGGDAAPYGNANLAENSLGLLLLATDQDATITKAILSADPKYVARKTFTSQVTNFTPVAVPLMKDAWGNYIRFVHPKYQGGYGTWYKPDGTAGTTRSITTVNVKVASGGNSALELRRSYRPYAGFPSDAIGDADEGLCTGGAGYFYSPGPDKDPGTRSDNVYISAPPVFPTETAKY